MELGHVTRFRPMEHESFESFFIKSSYVLSSILFSLPLAGWIERTIMQALRRGESQDGRGLGPWLTRVHCLGTPDWSFHEHWVSGGDFLAVSLPWLTELTSHYSLPNTEEASRRRCLISLGSYPTLYLKYFYFYRSGNALLLFMLVLIHYFSSFESSLLPSFV